ncbi:stage II sporulation protein R [Desulfothermobacter acidiphilus]|uniref:stage II sporulation protein R n=1 Tax=Desulfothermobacter acidiphilus TaxID=1938353 RepID=UPI003F8A0BFD
MRKHSWWWIGAAVAVLGLALCYWRHVAAVRAYHPGNFIRIHIVANSDAPGDQWLKYRVRDAVITAMAPEFQGVSRVTEAREKVEANLERIREVAQAEVRAAGKDYPVEVGYGHFIFPERSYGQLTLPAGEYEAVRVVLGAGQGQNWWCVLFPPLCLMETGPAAERGKPMVFRSRFYEMARQHFFPSPEPVAQASSEHP